MAVKSAPAASKKGIYALLLAYGAVFSSPGWRDTAAGTKPLLIDSTLPPSLTAVIHESSHLILDNALAITF